MHVITETVNPSAYKRPERSSFAEIKQILLGKLSAKSIRFEVQRSQTNMTTKIAQMRVVGGKWVPKGFRGKCYPRPSSFETLHINCSSDKSKNLSRIKMPVTR